MKTNFIFFGTDEFAVGVLEALAAAGQSPAAVVTAPDRPAGRKMILTPPPVKIWADAKNISVIQPEKLDDDFVEQLKAYNCPVFVVASYGKIIPQKVIDLPKFGILNVHPSLLPRHRGATPLESAILSGDEKTGVSIMQIDAQMDHGPILKQQEITLTGNEYYNGLRDTLSTLGGKILAEVIPKWLAEEITPTEQNHDQATYTKKIKKEDGLINLADSAEINYRKIRAFTPWPGAYFFTKKNGEDLRVIIKRARLLPSNTANREVGLVIEKVLPAGRKEMDWDEFEKFINSK